MYGSGGGVVAGATTTAAGVAALPDTGENTLLMVVSYTAIAIGAVTVILHIVSAIYRRNALKHL